MRIHIATDHAGLDLSHFLIRELTKQGHDVFDHGPSSYDPLDDYPSFCINAARAVARDQAAGIEALGIVFGGSGNGEQIAANKVQGIRAALVWSDATAQLARRLGIPCRSGGGLCSSNMVDAQAGYESANTLLPTVLAGVHLVTHAAGWLEAGLVASYEKFVMDADQLGALHHLQHIHQVEGQVLRGQRAQMQ